MIYNKMKLSKVNIFLAIALIVLAWATGFLLWKNQVLNSSVAEASDGKVKFFNSTKWFWFVVKPTAAAAYQWDLKDLFPPGNNGKSIWNGVLITNEGKEVKFKTPVDTSWDLIVWDKVIFTVDDSFTVDRVITATDEKCYSVELSDWIDDDCNLVSPDVPLSDEIKELTRKIHWDIFWDPDFDTISLEISVFSEKDASSDKPSVTTNVTSKNINSTINKNVCQLVELLTLAIEKETGTSISVVIKK